MVANAGTSPCLWQPPLLTVCQEGWLGCSQLCLQSDVYLIVHPSMDALQAISNSLELLCSLVVVYGVMDCCALGSSCLTVGRKGLDLHNLWLRMIAPDLQADYMFAMGLRLMRFADMHSDGPPMLPVPQHFVT